MFKLTSYRPLALLLAGLFSFGSALALTDAEILAARQAAQSEGNSFAVGLQNGAAVTDPRTGAAKTTTTLGASSLITSGSTPGAGNVWGSQYTGRSSIPASLTDKQTSSSMIAIGNIAKGDSVNTFNGYNNTRADQFNQSNYFLSQAPVLKPSISPTEPWIAGFKSSFASALTDANTPSPTKPVCTTLPAVDTPAVRIEHTCSESYVPYVVSCTSQGTDVGFELVPAPVVPASVSYSCPTSSACTNFSGGSCSTSTVHAPGTPNTEVPKTNYGCSAGQVLSGTNCISTTTQNATPNYSCATGVLTTGNVCTSSSTIAATPSDFIVPPPGYVLNTSSGTGNTYIKARSFGSSPIFNTSIDSSTGKILGAYSSLIVVTNNQIIGLGSECQTISNATGMVSTMAYRYLSSSQYRCDYSKPNTYTCPSGYALSGTTCSPQSSTTPASVTYTCPSGSTLSGTTCTSTSTTPATQTFTCNPGFTYDGTVCVNGGTCTSTTTATGSATSSYACPSGGTLNGANCVSTSSSSSPATNNGAGCFNPYATDPCANFSGVSCSTATVHTPGITSSTAAISSTAPGTCADTTTKITQAVNGVCPSPSTVNSTKIDYSCPAGTTLSTSGSGTPTCVSQVVTTSTAVATAKYSCAAGETLNGVSCVKTVTNTQAPMTNYGCSTGQVLSGTNCISTATQSATANYSCSTGILTAGNVCAIGSTYGETDFVVPPGSYVINSGCNLVLQSHCYVVYNTPGYSSYFVLESDSAGTHTRAWSELPYWDSRILGIVNTDSQSIINVTGMRDGGGWYRWGALGGSYAYYYGRLYMRPAIYTCPSGYTLSADKTRCNASAPASVTYTCPSGFTLSGTTCTSTSTTPATQTFTCNPGFTYDGTVCKQSTTSSTAANVSYSCPSGATLSGTNCISSTTTTNSQPAIAQTVSDTCRSTNTSTYGETSAVYSCPAGATLSGTSCLIYSMTTTPATQNYSCPADAVLSGSTCTSTSVSTASGTPNYSCPANYTQNGNQCTGSASDKVVETVTANGCGALEGLSN